MQDLSQCTARGTLSVSHAAADFTHLPSPPMTPYLREDPLLTGNPEPLPGELHTITRIKGRLEHG